MNQNVPKSSILNILATAALNTNLQGQKTRVWSAQQDNTSNLSFLVPEKTDRKAWNPSDFKDVNLKVNSKDEPMSKDRPADEPREERTLRR